MHRRTLLAVGLAFALTTSALAAEKGAPQEKPLKETLESLLPGMGAENIPDRARPQQEWQRICYEAGTPGNEARREEVCKLMATKLGPDVAAPARIWLLKQLEIIGRGECVDAVATLLNDKDEHLRDAARRCLANNPDPTATAKLVAALQAASDSPAKVGLLNALGYRADKAATSAIAKELGNADQAVACAAARALGKIAAPEAAKALAAAKASAKGEVRLRVCDSLRLCAEALLAAGNAAEATAIYKGLYQPDESRPVRLAGLQGLLRAAGDGAAAMVLELLAKDDDDARAIATGHVADLPASTIPALAEGLGKLPPAGQALLLGALAARRDKAAMPAALAAARSADDEVKAAGLRALGAVGDASAIPTLVAAMAEGGPPSGPAREGLVAVSGKGADEAILAAMQAEKDPGKRGDLISVLEARRAVAAVPALLQEAAGDDAGVRSRAMSALGRLAEPKDIPAMVKALLKADKGGEHDNAEKAIAAVCQQIAEKEKRAEPVLTALANASEADTAIALPLLGRLGGPKAMDAVQAALKSGNAESVDAAVRALCNWPDAAAAEPLLGLIQSAAQKPQRIAALQAFVRVTNPSHEGAKSIQADTLKKALEATRALLGGQDAALRETALRALADWPTAEPAADLLKLAQTAPEPKHRILALRGYIRAADLVAGKSAQDALAMYQEAMAAATRPDEKRQALSGLSRVKDPAALKLVVPCLDDGTLKGEAASAVYEIANSLKDADRPAAKPALQKALGATADARLRRRIEGLLKKLK